METADAHARDRTRRPFLQLGTDMKGDPFEYLLTYLATREEALPAASQKGSG